MDSSPAPEPKTWHRDGFTITTEWQRVPVDHLIQVFDSVELHWAQSMPKEDMVMMLKHSLSFAVFDDSKIDSENSSGQFMGFARCITDYTTLLYLTDVWIDPNYQGKGLGKWLITCVNEVIEGMPFLRRSLLVTSDWERSVPFYEKLMDMQCVYPVKGSGVALMEKKGPCYPDPSSHT